MACKEELKLGDNVRVQGDVNDFTDHLDGCVGEIINLNGFRDSVMVKFGESQCDIYFIGVYNIVEVYK